MNKNYVKKLLCSFILLTLVVGCRCQQESEEIQEPEQVFRARGVMLEALPQPGGIQKVFKDDPEIQNLVWNRFETDSFVVLSLDESQGVYLHENIENMKNWSFTRWGLPNIPFSAECRVLCVPTRDLMQKLFRLERSYAEVRRNKNGKIELNVLWLVLDSTPVETIPSALTVVCMEEYEQTTGRKVGFWAERGMSVLNSSLLSIRENLIALEDPLASNKRMHFTDNLFKVTQKEYKEKPAEEQALYDREAAVVCLLLRKEYGQDNFLAFIHSKGREEDAYQIIGISDFEQFDAILKRYMTHLTSDVKHGATPDTYLQIEAKGD